MTTAPAGPQVGTGPGAGSAVVIGGGLAGVTAALALADAGLRVTLTEARPRLGGLAFSFRRGDLTVDNGQHVFLRCCTAYQWFARPYRGPRPGHRCRTGWTSRCCDAATGRIGRIGRTALPVPLHLAASLARYPHLSLRERASVGRAALALRGLDLDDPALDRTDFGTWLSARGQSGRTIEALWDLVGVATLNATAGDASLGLAAKVFKTGLLSDPGAADIGWAHAPLGDLHDEAGAHRAGHGRSAHPAAQPGHRDLPRRRRRLAGRGGDRPRPPRATGRRHRGAGRPAARDARPAARRRPGRPEKLLRIGTAPILNVHVIYDRQVLAQPFLAALGSPVQWVFDRTESSGLSRRRPVPGRVAVRGPGRDRPSRGRTARPLPAGAAAAAARGEGRGGPRLLRHPRAHRDLRAHPGRRPRCGPARVPTRRACSLPGHGPPPAGPRPWRARYAAACMPPEKLCPPSGCHSTTASWSRHECNWCNKRRERDR